MALSATSALAPAFEEALTVGCIITDDESVPLITSVERRMDVAVEDVLLLGASDGTAGFDRRVDLSGSRVHGGLGSFVTACEADIVVISDRVDRMPREVAFAVVDLALKGTTICTLSDFLSRDQAPGGRIPETGVVQHLCLALAAGERETPARRAVEILVSALSILAALPLLALVALAVKIESPGPALFVQERLGQFRKPFRCIKFRTMRRDAEQATGPVWAVANDARITRIGRFLRRTRLDELPQLFNVLLGDMALIGPRPIRGFFADQLARQVPFYDIRFLTKPGITGLAQVRQAYPSTVEGQIEKFHLDFGYLRNRSLKLDLNIVFLTVGTLLRMTGK